MNPWAANATLNYSFLSLCLSLSLRVSGKGGKGRVCVGGLDDDDRVVLSWWYCLVELVQCSVERSRKFLLLIRTRRSSCCCVKRREGLRGADGVSIEGLLSLSFC